MTLKDDLMKMIQRLGGVKLKCPKPLSNQEFGITFQYPNKPNGFWFSLSKIKEKNVLKLITFFEVPASLAKPLLSRNEKEQATITFGLRKIIHEKDLIPEFKFSQEPYYLSLFECIYLKDDALPDANLVHQYLRKLNSVKTLCWIYLHENLSGGDYSPEAIEEDGGHSFLPMFS